MMFRKSKMLKEIKEKLKVRLEIKAYKFKKINNNNSRRANKYNRKYLLMKNNKK